MRFINVNNISEKLPPRCRRSRWLLFPRHSRSLSRDRPHRCRTCSSSSSSRRPHRRSAPRDRRRRRRLRHRSRLVLLTSRPGFVLTGVLSIALRFERSRGMGEGKKKNWNAVERDSSGCGSRMRHAGKSHENAWYYRGSRRWYALSQPLTALSVSFTTSVKWATALEVVVTERSGACCRRKRDRGGDSFGFENARCEKQKFKRKTNGTTGCRLDEGAFPPPWTATGQAFARLFSTCWSHWGVNSQNDLFFRKLRPN